MVELDFQVDAVDALILDCLHQDPQRAGSIETVELDDVRWKRFVPRAIQHKVSALLFYRLKTRGLLDKVPDGVQQQLRERYLGNAAKNMRNFFFLKDILNAFNRENIPVLVLKGAHLAHAVYGHLAIREMSDIDVLVPVERVRDADRVLIGMGYDPQSPWDLDYEIEHYKHVPVYTKSSSPAIELHLAITNPSGPCRFDTEHMWREQLTFEIEGTTASGLSPEGLLLHICAHAACDHGFTIGLQPFCDIGAIVRRYAHRLTWDAFEADAIRSGGHRGVYLALLLAKQLLGAGIPRAVFRGLESSGVHERIIAAAMNQVFGQDPLKNFRGVRSEVLAANGLWGKARGMMGRLFLSPKTVARIYRLDPHSLWVYPYYAVRLRDLIRQYGKTVRDYMGGNEATRTSVANVTTMDRWLRGVDD